MTLRTLVFPVALASLLLAACGGSDVPTIDCATATVKPYKELSSVFGNCTGCHGATNPPEGVRFDTYADAKKHAEEGQDEIASGSMPPDGGMSEADKQAFYTWAQCGTPE